MTQQPPAIGVGSEKGKKLMDEQNKEIEEMLERVQQGVKHTCNGCGHLDVCVVFRAVSGLLGPKNFPDNSKPFNPEDVGYVCRKWVSATVLKTLQGGS